MNRNKILMLIAVGLLVVSACAPVTAAPTAAPTESPAPAEPTATLEPVHLKLGLFALMTSSPLIIAAEEGYFADHGLDVELVMFSTANSSEVLPALLQGQLDVSGSSVSSQYFNAIAQGGTVKAVADKGFLDPAACPAEGWLARKDLLESGALDDPANLRGLHLTLRPGGHEEMMAEKLLQPAGLTLDDIQIETIPDFAVRIESFKTGDLDLSVLVEPWVTRARKAGAADMWMPWSSQLPGLSIGYLYYGPGMLEKGHDVGVRFMLAYLEGVRQYREGPTDRNVEILAAFTQLEPDEVRELCWPSFQPDGRIDLEALGEFEEWAFAKGYLDALVPLEDYWDPQFVEEASALLSP